MAFELGIHITAQAETDAGVKAAEQSIKQLGATAQQVSLQSAKASQRAAQQTADAYAKQAAALKAYTQGIAEGARAELQAHAAQAQSARAAAQTTGAYSAFNDASGKLAITQRNLGSAVGVVASQVGGLGPVANLAANAITTMALASGPAGLALAGLAATVGLLMYRIEQARERFRELSEIELAGITREQRGLNVENEIKRRIQILQSSTPEIEAIRQKYAELRLELEKGGARPQALAAVDQARDLEVNKLVNDQREKAAEKIKTFTESLKNQNVQLALQQETLSGSEQQVVEWETEILRATAAGLGLSETLKDQIATNHTLRASILGLKQEEQQRTANLIAEEAIQQRLKQTREEEIDYLTKRAALEQRAGDHQLNVLRAAGAPQEQIIRQELALLEQQRAALEQPGAQRTAGDMEAITQRIQLAQVELIKLQNTGIDVAGEIGRVVTDITSAIVGGTLKWSNVGKSILASFVRSALEQFTGMLQRMQQTQQSQAVLQQAGQSVIPAQAGIQASGGGGFFGGLFGGGSGGGGGFLSPLFSAFGGGGGGSGGGGFPIGSIPFGSLLSLGGSGFGALGGLMGGAGLGSLFGFGSAPAGMMGPLFANGGFFSSLGGALGAGSGAAAGGAGIMGSLSPLFSNPWTAVIAAVIMAITQILGNQKPNPTVHVSSKIEGLLYDALKNEFQPGAIKSRGTGSEIDSGTVVAVKNQVQELLEGWSEAWTDILNLFPAIVHDKMIPTLGAANARLRTFFGLLKFSEGGSRSIQEEMQALQEKFGPRGFFLSLRQTIGTGIGESLRLGGLGSLLPLVQQAFPLHPEGMGFIGSRNTPGLQAPRRAKDMEAFIQAIASFAQMTGSFATLGGPGGISQFLTAQDRARLEGGIGDVLKQTDGTKFTKEVEKLKQQISPITEFLNSAVQQSTDIFGRGLMAALDAASGSSALRQFNLTLGEGVKQILFQGITDAFIASAQFNDLLAPIQQTIRDFTQEAIASGQRPDIDAFRSRILPHIEDLATRRELLEELIREFQKLGGDFKNALKGFGVSGGATFNINIAEFTGSDQDVRALAEKLDDMLRGELNP